MVECSVITVRTRRQIGHMNARTLLFITTVVLFATAPAWAGTAGDGVKIDTEIIGRLYSWHVHNLDGPPIVRFEMSARLIYDHQVPDGWELEQGTQSILVAKAVDHRQAIRRGQFKVFAARAISSGTVPTPGHVDIGLEDGTSVVIGGVPVPRYEAASSIVMPPLVIAVMAALGFLLHRRRRSRL